MKIFLVGFMASGKSLLGEHLSAAIGCDFFDLDAMISEKEKCSIPEIFQNQGEAAFREMEATALRETRAIKHGIIATGGGTPCFSNNMDWMNQEGVSLYLEASTEVLFSRLKAANANRPLLSGKTELALKKYIENLLHDRLPFYSATHFSCNADLPIDELTRELAIYFCRFFH